MVANNLSHTLGFKQLVTRACFERQFDLRRLTTVTPLDLSQIVVSHTVASYIVACHAVASQLVASRKDGGVAPELLQPGVKGIP